VVCGDVFLDLIVRLDSWNNRLLHRSLDFRKFPQTNIQNGGFAAR
jgi:hypothetical protein